MAKRIELKRLARTRRHSRIRATVSGTGSKPRLSVFRSLNHIYAQIIDDSKGHTLASASTLDKEVGRYKWKEENRERSVNWQPGS